MMCLQDLKYKILVKGKKERVVEGCSSSCSDLSSSDEESSQARAKKDDKKVRRAAGKLSKQTSSVRLIKLFFFLFDSPLRPS